MNYFQVQKSALSNKFYFSFEHHCVKNKQTNKQNY